MIASGDAGPPPLVGAPERRARAPELIALTASNDVTVEVRYASPSGGRAYILWKRSGDRPCTLLIGDWTRGSMLVDRNGTRRFRLIARDEKAYDMSWEAGRLVLRRAGRVVSRSPMPGMNCDTPRAASGEDGAPR